MQSGQDLLDLIHLNLFAFLKIQETSSADLLEYSTPVFLFVCLGAAISFLADFLFKTS